MRLRTAIALVGAGAGVVAVTGVLTYAAVASAGQAIDASTEREKVRALGERVEDMGILPGFADFLVPVAYIESRFVPRASSGVAFGWFQLVPSSAFNKKNGLGGLPRARKIELLYTRPWAVAAAADYARRLLPYADAGQAVTFANLRHGWKAPRLVADTSSAGAAKNRRQFARAAEKTGVPLSMLDRTVTLGDWPGIEDLARSLGGETP